MDGLYDAMMTMLRIVLEALFGAGIALYSIVLVVGIVANLRRRFRHETLN